MISQMPGVHTSAISFPSVSISCRVLGPLPLGHSAFWTSSLNLSTLGHFCPGNLLSYLSEPWPVVEVSLVVTTLEFSVTSFSRLFWLASQAPSLQATVSIRQKKSLKIRNSALTCCPGGLPLFHIPYQIFSLYLFVFVQSHHLLWERVWKHDACLIHHKTPCACSLLIPPGPSRGWVSTHDQGQKEQHQQGLAHLPWISSTNRTRPCG
jgi:hypothetical protein